MHVPSVQDTENVLCISIESCCCALREAPQGWCNDVGVALCEPFLQCLENIPSTLLWHDEFAIQLIRCQSPIKGIVQKYFLSPERRFQLLLSLALIGTPTLLLNLLSMANALSPGINALLHIYPLRPISQYMTTRSGISGPSYSLKSSLFA